MINTPFALRKKIKNLIQEKNNVYKSYRNSKNNNNIHYLTRLKVLHEDLHNTTEVSELNYYCQITYKLTHMPKKYKGLFEIIKKVSQ